MYCGPKIAEVGGFSRPLANVKWQSINDSAEVLLKYCNKIKPEEEEEEEERS